MSGVDARDGILLLAAVWALVLVVAWLWLPRRLVCWCRQVTRTQAMLLIAAMALVARLVPNSFLPVGAGYDIESFQVVGQLVLKDQDVYASPEAANRHPYLPFQMYWIALALRLAQVTGLPFVKVVRMAPIAADIGIALALYLSLRRFGSASEALQGGLLYALNPISVLVSAYHGQFDAVPALLLLLSVLLVERMPLSAGGWLGLAILDKSWPVLALPSLWVTVKGWHERLRFLAGAVVVVLGGVGIYLWLFGGQVWQVLGRALGYNWGIGVWGYTYVFHLLSLFDTDLAGLFAWLSSNGRWITLAALGLVWLLRARRETPAAGVLTVLVTFLAVTHAFSIQYLVWVVPFAILNRDDRWLTRYTLGAFAYMLLAYTTLILDMRITRLLPWPQADWFIIMPAGLPAWLVTVGWAGRRLWRAKELQTF